MTQTLTRESIEETRTRFFLPRLLTFDDWLKIGTPKDAFELVDGTLIEKPMVQLEHEKLNLWLLHLLDLYVQERRLGTVLGTRSPVRISEFRGRMPDLFFVRVGRETAIGAKATTEAPDLVIELVSPNDFRSDIAATEADYRSIGVPEIVYIDQPRRRVRVLRRGVGGYTEETLTNEPLVLHTLGGLELPWNWLFADPRPSVWATLKQLLDGAPHPGG